MLSSCLFFQNESMSVYHTIHLKTGSDAAFLSAHLCLTDAGAGRRPGDDSEHGRPCGSGYDAALSARASPDQTESDPGIRPGLLRSVRKRGQKTPVKEKRADFFNSSQTPVKAIFRADFSFWICFRSDEKGLISFKIKPFSWSEWLDLNQRPLEPHSRLTTDATPTLKSLYSKRTWFLYFPL